MPEPTFDFGVVGGLAYSQETQILPANTTKKPIPKKLRRNSVSGIKKIIKEPGLTSARSAQACDRCRAKKLRCDGKLPACSLCAAAGLKCIVSDKLSRRAFPKGYTETLEERLRQLEAENTKLQGLVDLRDEQLAMSAGSKIMAKKEGEKLNDIPKANASEKDSPSSDIVASHIHDETCKCCSEPYKIHERPVSLAGAIFSAENEAYNHNSILSDTEFDSNSLLALEDTLPFANIEYGFGHRSQSASERPAPGAFAAATAIEKMQKVANVTESTLKEESKQTLLTSLVAASVPRSTEETLFVPTLLARICKLYGYSSKQAIVTAHTLASLKDDSNLTTSAEMTTQLSRHEKLLTLIMDKRSGSLLREESIELIKLLDLPPRIELDHSMTVFFQTWGKTLPILSEQSFLKSFKKLTNILNGSAGEGDLYNECELLEKCGAIMVLIVSLGSLSNKEVYESSDASEVRDRLKWYHSLIQEFVKPTCIITKQGSMLSLQILTLSLQYCLAVGDVYTCYELRGRVITMAQQLRLHRCPAAVLGLSSREKDVHLRHFMQGERRILFWCIYCLDVFASLNLGVPRLLKDFEIECAMPFSSDNDEDKNDRDNENILIINNTSLTIFGKVSRVSLSFMQYCKVLGNIVDSIFSRYGSADVQGQAMEKETILDSWRRDLPEDLKFQIDVNGFSVKTGSSLSPDMRDSENWGIYSKQQLCLIFLYYYGKIMIYLPIISKHGSHHYAGMSAKERFSVGQADIATVVSSTTMIQQSSIQVLKLLKHTVSQPQYAIPIPINISRAQAKLSLLVAQGSLDYIKGGALFNYLKGLLVDVLNISATEAQLGFPGGISENTFKLLEFAVLSLLGFNMKKGVNYQDHRKRTTMKSTLVESLTDETMPQQVRGPSKKQVHVLQATEITKGVLVSSVETEMDYSSNGDTVPTSHITPLSSKEALDSLSPSELNAISAKHQNLFGNVKIGQLDDEFYDFFKFDPFKMNHDVMPDFVADGSLGLVPFLDGQKTHTKEHDEENWDNLSDRMDEDGAFSFH